MAQSKNSGYELYAVCAAVSIGSKPYKGEGGPDPDGLRDITIMDQPGGDDDPFGGHKQREILCDTEVSEVPDGARLAPEDHPAYGYHDDRTYAVWVKGDDLRTVTVAYHDMEGL